MKRIFKRTGLFLITVAVLLSPRFTDISRAGTDEGAVLSEISAIQDGITGWKQGKADTLLDAVADAAGDASSDWYAFTAGRTGTDGDRAAYVRALYRRVIDYYASGDVNGIYPSELYRTALTVSALGGDPEKITLEESGAYSAPIDLIDRSIWHSTFGDPGMQGVNGYIWALLTVDSQGFAEPADAEWTREDLIKGILARQKDDGGFALDKTLQSDPDLTSMALTALAPYGSVCTSYRIDNVFTDTSYDITIKDAADKAFPVIAAMQADDGAMLTYGSETSESTSWAMISLASWGRDVFTDTEFTKNGRTLFDGLKTFVLDDGGIIHSPDSTPVETEGNNMAGYQAFYALEAVKRYYSGENRLFDLTDTKSLTQEDILSAEPLRTDGDDARDAEYPVYKIAIVAAAAVIVIVILLAVVLLHENKNRSDEAGEAGNDADDDWQ